MLRGICGILDAHHAAKAWPSKLLHLEPYLQKPLKGVCGISSPHHKAEGTTVLSPRRRRQAQQLYVTGCCCCSGAAGSGRC